MELNVLEEKKGKMIFELKGSSHTVCNVLKKELWKNSHVKNAGYAIKHPLVGNPEFVVETDGEDARKIVSAAAMKVKKEFEKFGEAVKKEIK